MRALPSILLSGLVMGLLMTAGAGCMSSPAPSPDFTPELGASFSAGVDGSVESGAVDAALPPPKGDTWDYLYATYFAGMTTPGHCGKSHTCHQTCDHNFGCGGDRDTCYCGMLWVGLVDPAHPTQSSIASPNSIVSWFNSNTGIMPLDNPTPQPQAAADILAWLQAGATDPALEDAGCAGLFLCQKPPADAGSDAPADAADTAADAPSE